MLRKLIVISIAMLTGGSVLAAEPDLIGDFGSWSAFTYQADGGKVCYIASEPTSEQGDYQRRGDVFALVTHRPADDVRAEVSVVTGYEYENGSSPRAKIGGSSFRLFTEGDTAWINDEDEPRLVAAMKAGAEMVVIGTSSRGTETTDTYSLIGFTKAMEAIDEACPR